MIAKWDDSIARMAFGTRVHATSISTAGNQIAVLAPEGMVFIYDSSPFEQPAYGAIVHHESVS
jgi:hypothetical protein